MQDFLRSASDYGFQPPYAKAGTSFALKEPELLGVLHGVHTGLYTIIYSGLIGV